MSIWFEGSGEIACSIEDVRRFVHDQGEHHSAVVGRMPGLTTVELLEEGSDFVVIKTNEGVMKRTGITKRVDADKVAIEFDEEYRAGSAVTTTAHFLNEFTSVESGVLHRAVVSDLSAPGFLGFLYRTFGRRSMGRAFLNSYRQCLEDAAGQPGSGG